MIKFLKPKLLELVTAVPPASEIIIVHDDGIYLMSFEQPVDARTIVHAERCNPAVDADYWDNARMLVGGDDFAETLCSSGQLLHLMRLARTGICVELTPTHLRVKPY